MLYIISEISNSKIKTLKQITHTKKKHQKQEKTLTPTAPKL